MKRQTKRMVSLLVVVLVIVAAAAVAWRYRPGQLPPKAPVAGASADANAARPSGEGAGLAPVSATGPATQPTTMAAADAQAAYAEGQALLKAGKTLQARGVLSRAFFSGQLTQPQEDQAVKDMAGLFDQTILSRELTEGDSYILPYTCKIGDSIEGRNGIEMTNRLHVPARLIMTINGLRRGGDLRQGQQLKLVYGPFHARVHKSRFVMDLYLEPKGNRGEGLERLFVKRLKVGLGRNDSTPLGSWRVKQGKKLEKQQAVYYPTAGSGLGTGPILYGQPGYAFGVKGMWIAMEGADPRTAGVTDFGIHSTNDPQSIGKANSLGCVRMSDEDIELVFALLYDVWSTVEVLP